MYPPKPQNRHKFTIHHSPLSMRYPFTVIHDQQWSMANGSYRRRRLRMNRWLTRANQRISLSGAAALLVVAALFSQLLGFLRTQIVNGNFNSQGHITTDAYFAAFKIPDFFFYTIAAGALGVAFMPFLADKLASGDRRSVWKLTSGLLNLLGVL